MLSHYYMNAVKSLSPLQELQSNSSEHLLCFKTLSKRRNPRLSALPSYPNAISVALLCGWTPIILASQQQQPPTMLLLLWLLCWVRPFALFLSFTYSSALTTLAPATEVSRVGSLSEPQRRYRKHFSIIWPWSLRNMAMTGVTFHLSNSRVI